MDRIGKTNNRLTPKEIEIHCLLQEKDQQWLSNAMEKLNLSARSLHRILRVARTIADLVHSDQILTTHLTEALTYRRLDRNEPNY
jgi:magnesium chelatase family protein